MLLTLRSQFQGGSQTPREIADATISALSPAAWYRNGTDVVSSGGFASIWGDYASSDVGLVLPGTSGNSASTPDSAALSITGDIDLIARASLRDWTPGTTMGFIGTTNAAATTGYQLRIVIGSSLLQIAWGDGAAFKTESSTVAPTVSDGETIWVRATLDVDNGGNYQVKFYTAPDSSSVPTSWTQLGDTVNGVGTTAIGNGEALYCGFLPATGTYTDGVIYRAIVKNGIDGTTVFDADFTSQAIGTSSFTESSSNAATVTVNQSGALPAHIGKARDLLQGTGTNQPAYSAGVFTFDGLDNYMVASTWLQAQPVSIYIVCKQATWAATDRFFDGTTADSMAVIQITATPTIAPNGVAGLSNGDLAVNTRGIVACVFNGVSSSIRVNNQTKVSGNVGATSPGGFTLGSRAGGGQPGNIAAEEVVIFSAAHDDATQSSVITALNNALTVF